MNNEPVAWAVWEGRPHDLFFTKEEADELCRLKGGDAKSIPLYTVPRELSDEEITVIAMQSLKETVSLTWNWEAIRHFARAILKKASEK
jgi:hypothetical protein